MKLARRWRVVGAALLCAALAPVLWACLGPQGERSPVECSVHVTVLRDEDGTPLAGARVTFGDRAMLRGVEPAPPAAQWTTGPDGRVEFTRLVAANFLEVAAAAEGRATVAEPMMTFLGCGRAPYVRRDHRFEFRLPRAGSVTGRVLAPDGAPMEGAQVGLIDRGHEGPWVRLPEAQTGADGAFRLDGVPQGRDVEIECGPLGPSKRRLACFEPPSWAGPASPLRVRITAERPEAQVEVRLRDVGTLVLRIVGPAGERVPAGAVDLTALDRQIAPRLEFADGAFRRTFEPGPYRLAVRADGFRASIPRDLRIAERGTTEIEVRLER